jgi:hypothetical protein
VGSLARISEIVKQRTAKTLFFKEFRPWQAYKISYKGVTLIGVNQDFQKIKNLLA